ncbi:quinone oxidoreductase [Fusarium avenaceum]|nr:quinone oxidoreductase [Fusarium avenaceum]
MASIPSTMNGVQFSRTGGAEVLDYKTDLLVPKLKNGEILVKNEYAGVNFIDTYYRTGLYKVPLPMILGREGAGRVVKAHDSVASSFQEGDSVAYMDANAGTYGSYSAIPAAKLLRIPQGLSTQQAAASLLQGLTAWTFIREAGQVKAGQWVLVHAAAGGVGTQLVQMLREVGAKVIGTASTDEKCKLAEKNGARWVINSKTGNIVEEVMKITDGHGIDVIFDGIGKATFDLDIELAARKGILVMVGNASGAVPPFNILRLGSKNVKLVRPVVDHYVATREELEEYSGELFEMLVSGKLKVDVHKVYEQSDAASAHVDLESRKTTGKLLLKIE